MVKILEGKTLAEILSKDLAGKFSGLDFVPSLAIIQVGDKEESNLYIKKKKEFGLLVGVDIKHLKFPENISQQDLEREIELVNKDEKIKGIIVQLPIPAHLNLEKTIESISPQKDADGLTSLNVRKLLNNDESGIIPATARAVLNLLDHHQIGLEGKKAVVVGRSLLVGKPVALSFLNRNATVTICHTKTKDIEEVSKGSDILVVATGKPNLITKDFTNKNQVIVDVGINTVSGSKMEDEIEISRKVVGDVDFEGVKDSVYAITPVPGGVGPLTVASLFQNLLDLCRN